MMESDRNHHIDSFPYTHRLNSIPLLIILALNFNRNTTRIFVNFLIYIIAIHFLVYIDISCQKL